MVFVEKRLHLCHKIRDEDTTKSVLIFLTGTMGIVICAARCHIYCVFSHDVMVAIFVSQNNETAAMLVSQTSPVGVELFSYVNAFFCSNKFA